MNPLDLIEKLITEHGSSAIQSKHLAMLKDEIAILLRKLDELSRENANLKAQLSPLPREKNPKEISLHTAASALENS